MAATNSSGVTSSGYPFGALTVCADDNAGTAHKATGTVTNTATGSAITLQINTWQSSAARIMSMSRINLISTRAASRSQSWWWRWRSG